MISGDIALWHYAIIAATAFVAALIGGLAGYGTGLLLPPVLLPIIGPEAVVPVVSISALFTNAGRLAAFWRDVRLAKATFITCSALPTCLLGAYGYTRLSGASVTLLVGVVVVALVPLRRHWWRSRRGLNRPALALASSGYGVLVGGTSGSGVVLLSILISCGLSGVSVIATDAGISLTLGLFKALVFQAAGALSAPLWGLALLIGVVALPGTFLARRLARRFSLAAYAALLDGVVLAGGGLLIVQGIRALL